MRRARLEGATRGARCETTEVSTAWNARSRGRRTASRLGTPVPARHTTPSSSLTFIHSVPSSQVRAPVRAPFAVKAEAVRSHPRDTLAHSQIARSVKRRGRTARARRRRDVASASRRVVPSPPARDSRVASFHGRLTFSPPLAPLPLSGLRGGAEDSHQAEVLRGEAHGGRVRQDHRGGQGDRGVHLRPRAPPTKRRIYCVLRSPHVNKDSASTSRRAPTTVSSTFTSPPRRPSTRSRASSSRPVSRSRSSSELDGAHRGCGCKL